MTNLTYSDIEALKVKYYYTCERLDVATNVWVVGPDLPSPSSQLCCAVV